MKKSSLSRDSVQALHKAGRLDEAKQGYLDILKDAPNDAQALHLLSLVYAEQDEIETAQHYLEQAIHINPDNPVYQLHLANLLKTRGLFSQALQVLEELIQNHPRLAAAFNNLGTVYFAQKKWLQAVHAYQTAIDIQPDYSDAYYNLGLAFNKLKRIDEAMNVYTALTELAPTHAGAQFQLGCLLMLKNNYQTAITHFSIIEQAHPFHVETQTNLATCYLKQGLLNEAKAHYLLALQVAPDDVQVLFNLGVINMQQGDVDQAVQYYLRAVNLDTNLYEAHNNLGFIFLVRQDKANALLHFRAALRLQPDNIALSHTIHIIEGGKNVTISPPEYVRSLFDSYADHFDSHLTQALHYRVPAMMYDLVQAHVDLAGRQWDVLDLGCGTGLSGLPFKAVARSLTGVDLSEKMLGVAAQKKCYDQLIQADILPYLADKQQAFDLIIAGDVVVYFGDLDALFAAVAQALKPQGLFVFDTEMSGDADFKMLSSGRFAHSKKYLDDLMARKHLVTVAYTVASLRTQNEKAVRGHVYLVKREDDEVRPV